MKKRLGIITGKGKFSHYVFQEAEKLGYECVVAEIGDEKDSMSWDPAVTVERFEISRLLAIIDFLKQHNIAEVIFAGKIDPGVALKKPKLGIKVIGLLSGLKDRKASTILNLAIEYLSRQGIEVLDPSLILGRTFCRAGILSRKKPSSSDKENINFGWEIARKIADLDIGQTLIVKNLGVVAVEGIEGTDQTILRGGKLGGEGTLVIKVCRSQQDARIDLPAVGLETIECMAAAGCAALCFEADRMPFFERDAALELADERGISIIAR